MNDVSEPGERPAVLVVEHDHDSRQRMVAALGADYQVVEASGFEHVLGQLRDLVPDVIVSEWPAPEMREEKWASGVRDLKSLEGVSILWLTAATDAVERSRILQSGADDYLIKPFEPDEFRARIEKLVTMRRERQQLQRALEANREIAEFLSLLSHELRSPLAAIQLQLELLVRGQGQPDSSRTADIVARMARSSSRVSETLDLLLHFAGIESGNFTPEAAPLDLVAIASQVVEALRSRAVAKKLGVQFVASAGATIRGDAKLVKLLIAHLCDTALKYVSAGELAVAVDRSVEGAVRVSVEGEGLLPESERQRLFQSAKVERARGEKRPDVGIRLLLVKRIAGVLGADLSVEDAEDGSGTRLTLRFQAHAQD